MNHITDLPQRILYERRALQIAMACVAVFPLALGSTLTLLGMRGFYVLFGLEQSEEIVPTLDSGVRFLAANFFGMGMVMLWIIPRIERETTVFRIIAATMVLGASGRMISMATIGQPSLLTVVLTIVESSGLLLLFWQQRVSKLCT